MSIPLLPTILCALALAASGPTPHRVHPLGADGVALEGLVDSTSMQVVVPSPEQREGPATLDLHWRASTMALPGRSTLTVRWNGVPLATSSLEQLTQDGTPVPLRVVLPDTASGYGTLSVASHLTLEGPACETAPDGAWVALDAASSLQWVGTDPIAPTVDTLRDWWSTAPGEPLAIALTDEEPLSVLAAIELDHHLRDLGRTTRPRANRTVHLSVGSMPADAPLAAAAMVRVRPDGGLAVRAENPDQLHAVVLAFDQELDRRCALPTCWIPRQQPAVEGSAEPRNPLQVATVSDAGHARGWTTHGSGPRHLRMVWRQPPGTKVEPGEARIRLQVDHIGIERLDADRSHLAATLNGRPLGTWSFSEPGVLEATVPEDLLDDDTWVLDVDASLWPKQDERCRWLDPSALWLVVSADSGLEVARREARTGLSAIPLHQTDRLAWNAAPSPRARWALATVAHSLPPPPGGWHVTDPVDCADLACIVLGEGPTLGADGERWTDHAGTLAQPLSLARGASLEAHGDDVLLSVGGPLTGLVAPPWHQLGGPVALQDGAVWTSLGTAPVGATRTVADPAQDPGRPTDEEASTRALDLVFGLVFLLTLFGAAGWVWSGVRRGKPVEEL